MGFDSLGFETSPPPKSAILSAVVDNEAGLARFFWIKFRRESVWGMEWRLDAKDISISSAAVKYTEFLLATASGKVEGVKCPGKLATPFERTKVAAYTLGAMTPCMIFN
ncbi:hypothetical protein OROMI_007880 [Orobanche minor]